ncbi:hypothetical protein J6590_036832 [Homalodisca vitripennis]|nr:hypothetical protein J6590_036832 [Homalodisca vitripennis]
MIRLQDPGALNVSQLRGISCLLFLACLCSSQTQQQPQLVTQTLRPSQVTSFTSPPGHSGGGPAEVFRGAAASLGQLFINLLNYKMRWLGHMAGNLPGGHPIPGSHLAGSLGYPFTTTLVTTLSGNSPTIPGVTITGAPTNPLQAGSSNVYPGQPVTQPGVTGTAPIPQTGYPAATPAPQPGVAVAPVSAPISQTGYPGTAPPPQPGVAVAPVSASIPQTGYPVPQPGVSVAPVAATAPQTGYPPPQTGVAVSPVASPLPQTGLPPAAPPQ